MKKLLAIIVLGLLFSGNAYADETQKELENIVQVLKHDLKLKLNLNSGSSTTKDSREKYCRIPNIFMNLNFKSKKYSENETWGCLSGDCNNGKGTYRAAGGDVMKGNFKSGRLYGNGVFTFGPPEGYSKGTRVETEFYNGCFNGPAKVTTYKGKTFLGSFSFNTFSRNK